MTASHPDPILRTKLYIPQVRPSSIRRDRLVARLVEGTTGALTLLSAPAGFGKTTLLAEWAAGRQSLPAWLSLDADDNDPARFIAYVARALNAAGPLSPAALARISAASGLPAQTILLMLLQELDSLDFHFSLVLDDYHLITARPVHQILTYLLDHLPPVMHLVIATRVDPPIPLARLRARGELLELRAADLRFSPTEAADFLSESMGLDLDAVDVAALEARTEGWIAGLQMAALAMKGKQDLHGFIQTFSGSHHFILDFLAEEVITRQPDDVQAFLLQTALLERFNAALCQAVTGMDGASAQEFIERLERSNLFLIALDDERQWFRYHHLFSELLRARLQQNHAEQVPLLHLRAARWYERSGYPGEAVQHALAAEEIELAAAWIEQYWQQRWAASDRAFMLLIGRLPPELLRSRPLLGIYQSWMWILYGQIQNAQPLLADLAKQLAGAPDTPESAGLRGFVDLLQVYCADLSGESSLVALPDPLILEKVPPDLLAMRNSADVVLAILLSARGEFQLAEQILLKTIRRDTAAAGTTAVPISVSLIARNRIIQGRLHEAAALCRKHIHLVDERGAWQFYLPGNLNVTLGDVLREWNRLDEAEQHIREGAARNSAWDIPMSIASAASAEARLQRARGNPQAGLAAITQAEEALAGRSMPLDALTDLHLEKVRLWLESGDLASAAAWADTHPAAAHLDCRLEPARIVLARVRIAQGRYAEAHALLQPLAASAQAGGRAGRLAAILLLDGLALWALAESAPAFERVDACLNLAAPQDYRRLFLDGGEPVRALLSAYCAAPNQAHQEYAQRLLDEFGGRRTALAPAQPGLIEPLSAREIEVLRLVCAGLSNQDIAEKLFITVSAVKKHTGNIYGKLGVSSRTQAVARARRLGLDASDE